MSPRGVLTTLTCALSLLAMTGCGLEGQASTVTTTTEVPTEEPGLADTLVTPVAIAELPPGSLRGVVLSWWRGVQFRDHEAVIDTYAPDVGDELPKKFPEVLATDLAPVAADSSIRINSLEPSGNGEATVYLTLYSPDERIDGPLALPMEKIDDEWRINDATFLDVLVKAFLAAADEEAAASANGTE